MAERGASACSPLPGSGPPRLVAPRISIDLLDALRRKCRALVRQPLADSLATHDVDVRRFGLDCQRGGHDDDNRLHGNHESAGCTKQL